MHLWLSIRDGQRWRIVASLLVIFVILATPGSVDSHAFLERSDPAANQLLAAPPDEARLWFTEPLEVEYSQAGLYDALGNQIETGPSRIGPEPNLLVLPLPETLAIGTYTIAWHNISTADGHPAEGFVPFTIGTQVDIRVPVPPDITDFNRPSTLVSALGRWISLLGMIGLAGCLAVWWWVIRPGLLPLNEPLRRTIEHRVTWLALAGVLTALAGSLLMLAVQVATVNTGFSATSILDLLTDSRFGQLWIWRVALLLVPGILMIAGLRRRRLSNALLGVALGAALFAMIPYALNSHAAAVGVGRQAAVAAQIIHLVAVGIWVGGLIALAVALLLVYRSGSSASQREATAIIIPRFSTLAIGSVVVISLTGFYAAWLQLGGVDALRETGYGQVLLVKILLVCVMLLLGAVNFFYLEPRLRAGAQTGRHFSRTVAGEAALGIAVLFVAGVLASLPAVSSTAEEDADRAVYHLFQDDIHATLYLSPGVVGTNRYTVDFDLDPNELPAGTNVILRTSTDDAIRGVREITLLPDGPSRFEATGSELSVAGQWDLELILRRPAQQDWRVTTPVLVQASAPAMDTPEDPAPRFGGISGAALVVVVAIAILLLTVTLRHHRTALAVGIVVVVLVGSFVGLVTTVEPASTTEEHVNPIAVDENSIAAGSRLFETNCATCHGEDGRGVALLLSEYPGVNLGPEYVVSHDDFEVFVHIRDGIVDSPMPAFDSQLTEEEIWRIVIFIQDQAMAN